MQKIISIIPHTPPYELYSKGLPPEISWNTPGGQRVGIWINYWANRLGNEILKLTDEFNYEVWQPDLRADRIYSHTFENGLTHRLFPAKKKKRIYGLKVIDEIYSKSLMKESLNCVDRKKVIVHLNGALHGITKEMLAVKNRFNFPVVLWRNGDLNLPSTRFFKLNKNIFCKFNTVAEHIWLKKNINRIDYFVYCNDKDLNHLFKIYHGKTTKINSGCYFSFWVKQDKQTCRQELDLPQDTFIFFSASRFTPLKQIDRFIQVLNELSDRYDFLYLLAGHGEGKHASYLQKLAGPLIKKGQMKFVGYITGEKLLRCYNAADIFVSTSLSEGGPTSAAEAFACELPVFSTETGSVAELMKKEGAGILVQVRDYKGWQRELKKLLESRNVPKIVNREAAKEQYDWKNIAGRFLSIYREIC